MAQRKRIIYPKSRRVSFGKKSNWFEEFWKLNGKALTEKLSYSQGEKYSNATAKAAFKRDVLQNKASNYLPVLKGQSRDKAAVEATLRTRVWGGQRANLEENIKTGIKYFGSDNFQVSSKWKELQNITRTAGGRFQKVEWDTLKSIGDEMYTVKLQDGRTLLIDFENSPKDIIFSIFEKGRFRKDRYLKSKNR